jgi:hypothetical protein
MGYFTRVFCKSNSKPNVKQILEKLNSKSHSAKSNLDENELQAENWTDFELIYKEGKLPILVELNEIKKSDGLAEEEIEEFKEAIGKPGLFDSSKKKVLKHLNQTTFILCNQLPTSDIDDDGYDINGELMEIFATECEGMVQCDGEGFYSGTKLIIKE